MYYDRTISDKFSQLIEPNGSLRWIYEFVKQREDLDFQIGKSGSIVKSGTHGKNEWISIYRGLTRIFSLKSLSDQQMINLYAHSSYQNLKSSFYGMKDISVNFQIDIEQLIVEIDKVRKFDKFYNNKKEGYYQNILSRTYGICSDKNSDFVIIDKEAVVGYKDQAEKDLLFGSIQVKYKQLQELISKNNPKRYGQNLQKKAIGNELDFLALDKDGNILLIEYKHWDNPSGIYLSPLQIGLYYDIFTSFPRDQLDKAVYSMLEQKQKMGLINPGWVKPPKLKDIIPVLIISEYNYNSSSKTKFDEILNITRDELGDDFLSHLQKFNFTLKNGLTQW